MVCHIDFIVILGKILCSGNKIPIIKPGISLNRRSLIWGSAPYILLQLLWEIKQMFIIIQSGDIVKPKIVKPGFHCIVFRSRFKGEN